MSTRNFLVILLTDRRTNSTGNGTPPKAANVIERQNNWTDLSIAP